MTSSSEPALEGDQARKNLRDFYKLQKEETSSAVDVQHELSLTLNDLDAPSVDANEYVAKLLTGGSLSELARTAAGLEHEINTLDSEQKSLVYNNYKKLIRASETLGYIAGTGPLDGLEAMVPQFEEIAAMVAENRERPPVVDFAKKYDLFIAKHGSVLSAEDTSTPGL